MGQVFGDVAVKGMASGEWRSGGGEVGGVVGRWEGLWGGGGVIPLPTFLESAFGVFCDKKRDTEFYQYPVLQKSGFKKLYEIFTDDYDNDI